MMWPREALLPMVSGAIVMGYAIAGLFFLRFWRQTRDRLFLIFATSFWLLGIQRAALALTWRATEDNTGLYLLRLLAYALILAAIIDTNRGDSRAGN